MIQIFTEVQTVYYKKIVIGLYPFFLQNIATQ